MGRYQIVEDGSVVGFVDSGGGSFTWSYSGEKAKVQSLLTHADSFKTHAPHPDGDGDIGLDYIGMTILTDARPEQKLSRLFPEMLVVDGMDLE